MTLLDAMPYDPGPARRRKVKIVVAAVIVVVLAVAVWMNRYWSEERVVGRFFAALKSKDYETAYGICTHFSQKVVLYFRKTGTFPWCWMFSRMMNSG